MIDMSTWKERVVDVVDDLHLDPRNVRLESPDGVTEADIAQDLFSNEEVLGLVDGIAKVGYLTHEVPIVVSRDGLLVVVEGNRRVAALKAIQNPYMVPYFQVQVTKIANTIQNRDSLRKIRVKLAPSDDDANQLIGAIHTGSQRRAWSPTRQAAFFQAQLDSGKKARDLIDQYPTVDVKKFILRSQFLQLFKLASYSDLELKSFVSNRRFPVSTLERLYPNSEFLEILGLTVNDRSLTIKRSLPEPTFDALAEKVIGDVRVRYIDTRKLNKMDSDFYKSYLNELRSLRADVMVGSSSASGGGPGSVAAGTSSTGGSTGVLPENLTSGNTRQSGVAAKNNAAPGSSTPMPTPPPKPARRSNYLEMADIEVGSKFPLSVQSIAAELSKINISLYPNATLDLLRTFLEKTVKAHAELEGVDIRTVFSLNGYVYLSHALEWLEKYFRDNGQVPMAQVAKKIRSSKVAGYVASMDHMNAVNHNHRIHASVEDVRECWATMHEMVRVVLKP